MTKEGKTSQLLKVPHPYFSFNQQHIPNVSKFFCWHEDTFDLPEGATLLAVSDACPAHLFSYSDTVFAFQYHPEMSQASK
jgi:GMP synthase-like glutamine amidotransferase